MRANTGETLKPRTLLGYGVLVCLRRKQPDTLRLMSRAFRGINRRRSSLRDLLTRKHNAPQTADFAPYPRLHAFPRQKKKPKPNNFFKMFDLGFTWWAELEEGRLKIKKKIPTIFRRSIIGIFIFNVILMNFNFIIE